MITLVWEPIIDQCIGCEKIMTQLGMQLHPGVYLSPDTQYCKVFMTPSAKWKNGKCSVATHVAHPESKEERKVNPLKASKRSQGK